MGTSELIRRVVGVTLFTIRTLAPWIARLVVLVAQLLMLALAGWFKGVIGAVDNMGSEYIQRAALAGVPSRFHPTLYYASCVLAVVELTAGWCVASYLTVWIVNVVLHR